MAQEKKTRRPRVIKSVGSNPDLSYIAEPLRQFAVPIDQLTIDPKNARKHNARNIAGIKSSLKRFGQRQLLVVRRDSMVVHAGNGRVIAAKELGWSHVAALVVDDTEADAVSFAIADNRTAELAEWDYEMLPSALKALVEGAGGFDGGGLQSVLDIGFSESELEDLLDLGPTVGDGLEPGRLTRAPSLTLEFTDKALRDAFKAFVKSICADKPSGDSLAEKFGVRAATRKG